MSFLVIKWNPKHYFTFVQFKAIQTIKAHKSEFKNINIDFL